jgi:DUF4097 and DUF4098 domain-containing protein YvlB
VKTASGDVRCDRVDARVSANSASGDIEIDAIGGACELRTVSGDVTVSEVGGVTHATSVSGDLTIVRARDSVRAKTVSGDIELHSVARGTVKLNSVSGDMEVGVTRGTAVWMDLTSMSGSTKSDLDISHGRKDEATELEIRASSVSGDIRVTHEHGRRAR